MEQGRAILKAQPFSAWLEVQLLSLSDGQVELGLDVRDELLQHHGFVHGGVLAAMADLAIAAAGASAVGDPLTCEFKISFLRPAKCHRLIARGLLLRSGAGLASCEAKVFSRVDVEEKLVAAALGTVAPRPKQTAP